MASSSYIRKLVEILFLIPNILRLHSSKSDTIRDDHKGSHKNFGIDVAVFFKSIPGSGLVSGKSSSNFVQLFQKTRQNFRSISQKVKNKQKKITPPPKKKYFSQNLRRKIDWNSIISIVQGLGLLMKEKPVYLLSSYIQNILNSLVTLLIDNYPSATRGISEGLQLASARNGKDFRIF